MFDSGASHSFISTSFASMLNLEFVPLYYSLYVETPMGGKMEAKWVCNACVLYIGGYEVTIDLVLLHMSAFDVIVGMDWLAQHHVVLDCYLKKVTFQISNGSCTSFYGDRRLSLIRPMKELDKKWLRRDVINTFFLMYKERVKRR